MYNFLFGYGENRIESLDNRGGVHAMLAYAQEIWGQLIIIIQQILSSSCVVGCTMNRFTPEFMKEFEEEFHEEFQEEFKLPLKLLL